MNKFLAVLFLVVFSSFSYADQGGLISSPGGSLAAIGIANPPGTLSITPLNLTFTSNDGSTIIHATFSSSKTVESCSGGGKGGNVKCSFTFTGSFSGTLTVNGAVQAINGTTNQVYASGGIVYGGTGYNSAYTPFYFTDGNARILRADDLSGTNAIAYGMQGSGTGQFYGPSGIALDSAGRIYITDTYNDRIVRIDDINGTNWTSFGSYGSGVGQFAIPQSVSIDPSGHIWVLDNGNGRLVRMDDMNGTNWTVVGTSGSGVGQFSAISSAPGFDSTGRIYVADAGNRWIARFDDLSFTNWTTLSQSQPVGPYLYTFGSPVGVVVDQASKIYVADGSDIVRVDDMTGANWTSIGLGANNFAHTIAIDSLGMVLVGNGYNAQIVDSEVTVLTSAMNNLLVQGVYVSVYGAVPISLSSPRPAAIGFTPNTLAFSQNAGSTSPAQTITISNFGGSPLSGLNVSTSGAFSLSNNCPTMLSAGSSCAVAVTFTPASIGPTMGALNISDNSGNMGPSQSLELDGTGTTPAANVSPTSLSFQSQVVGTTSNPRTITLQSTGTGALQVSSVTASGPFSQTNTCVGSIASGASCTIQVTFAPTVVGSATGSITITDDAGTQTMPLSGNGSAPVSLSSSSLNFGSLSVGSTSSTHSVTVTNRLNTALTFTSVTTAGPFTIASNNCGASIGGNANCTVGVTFTPTALGGASGTLTLTDSANTSPQVVNLSGNGTAPVTLSTTTLSFNTTVAGATSSARSVTVTNQQTVALNIASVVTTSGFAIASNTCGASLAAGASCTVGVTFSPSVTGSVTGTLTFTDDAGNSPQKVSLSGTGSSPVTFSTSSLNFGTVRVGTTSSAKSVTLTNRLGNAVSMSSVTASAGFTVSNNSCGSSIPAGGNCSVNVTFSPTATGPLSGTLTFVDSAATSPQSVALSGAGQ